MFRILAQWYISRSIDEDRKLPAWVGRRLETDRKLRDFFDRSLHLAGQLQGKPLVAARYLPVRHQGGVVATYLDRFVLAGTSALVAMIALVFLSQRNTTEPGRVDSSQFVQRELPVNGSGVSDGNGNPGAEQKPSRWKSLTTPLVNGPLVARLKPNAEMAKNVNDARQLLAFVQTSPKDLVKGAGDLGGSYGRILKSMGKECGHGSETLISQGTEAYRYFTEQLPTRAKLLAGL